MTQASKLQTGTLFILFTFLITWGVNIPLALASHHMISFSVPRWLESASTFSPGIVAIVMTLIQSGKMSLKKLLLKIIKWRVNIKWYAFALIVPLLAVSASLVIYHLTFRQAVDTSEWYLPLILLFIFLPFSPLWEEIGWRGFLLPLLQAKFSPLFAALILGLIWGIWHIPMYLVHNPEGARTGQFLVFFILGTIPLTILFAWLFNKTGGSLFITIFFHSAINASFTLFSKIPTGELRPFIFCMIAFTIIALLIVWKSKGSLGAQAL